jgi:hypothetical protein
MKITNAQQHYEQIFHQIVTININSANKNAFAPPKFTFADGHET